MKSSKLYNNISDKLKALIPKLKPNEVMTFRMLNGIPNPDPDPREKEKDPMLYGKVQIPTNTRIFDSYKGEYLEGEETKYRGEYVDLCCADQWEGDRPTKFRFFMPGMGAFARFQGKFSLTGGNGADEELFEYLFLCPYRKGSPCADSGVETLFELIDLKADVKSSSSRIDKLRLSLTYVDELKKDTSRARAIMAAFNKPSYQDDEVLMSHIHNMATDTKTIDDFISTYENGQTPIIGILKEAQDAGILNYDVQTGSVSIGNTSVVNLKIASASGFLKEMANWINTSENGKDVFSSIKSRLSKAEVAK